MSSALHPILPMPGTGLGSPERWPELPSSALALALAERASVARGALFALVADARAADQLRAALEFFAPDSLPVMLIPEREMLPYDVVSPPRELVSERLRALTRLPSLPRGIAIATADLVLERLPPRTWLAGAGFDCRIGQRIDPEGFTHDLVTAGYAAVAEVRAPGEFAVRGGLIDVFPSGTDSPIRIDLFDEEIETLRYFDPETQLSGERLQRFALLPAWEFPFQSEGIRRFRQAWRARFAGDPMASQIYRDISSGRLPPGIESWLPLFFETSETIAEHLPSALTVVELPGFRSALSLAWEQIGVRYEAARHDLSRPLLPPAEAFVTPEDVLQRLGQHPQIEMTQEHSRDVSSLPELVMEPKAEEPLQRFLNFTHDCPAIVFTAESPGRRETVRELLARRGVQPALVDNWEGFHETRPPLALAIAELSDGFVVPEAGLAVVPDSQVFGARVATRRQRRRPARDPATILRDLTDLTEGAPVVHQDHGVGRFRGLVAQEIDNQTVEFVLLEYADGDRLYVPVSSLDRLSRYLGADADHAPLTRLGSGQWERARKRAETRARDAAAELLELYARRGARAGVRFPLDMAAWDRFSQAFPFDETPDQERAIQEILGDLTSERPMDRLVCGDVGFGKTEVALRAAFVAVHAGYQVAVLVPTTLLADQHYRSFLDRFADWPVTVELLSRFRSAKAQASVRGAIAEGRVDIVIGTHALLGRDVRFKSLGLVIVDEEHRFGVRHKERLKALRAEVDVLTLTATPIPRTLSMTLAGIRDLSLIATPPEERLPIRTVVSQWQDAQIRDAILREIRRGGQVFVVHNEVRSIGELAQRIRALVPEATVRIGHGQMAERELEALMVDFYHRRFDILVSTTIIESGIDIPTANTILINNAHRFGLAQLHQLRGRVGRSHHQAYAYLLTPPQEYLGRDARARLDAVASLEELGAGFFLATQDLEIRGAGALLGESQSGQIEEVGLDLYNRLLARAIATLKAGGEVQAETELDAGCEVDLGAPALLPADYVPDVHMRLVLYKRIASAATPVDLEALFSEITDRFGPLPEAASRLFQSARLKQQARRIGVTAVRAGADGGRIDFGPSPHIDAAALVALVQDEPRSFRLQGQKRISFRRELPHFDDRVAQVSAVLEAITPDSAGSSPPAKQSA